MKRVIFLVLFIAFLGKINAQNFTGQWKGKFLEKSTSFMGWGGDECDYVLELEVKGKTVTGYSYTYFNDGGKRYYTICKLTGFTNKASKYIEVREIERTKTNVPRHISNCFQIHKLTFFKQGNEETLEGSWIPAPNQDGDCGSGTTTLTRRVLQTKTPAFNNATTRVTKPKQPIKSPEKPKPANTKPPVVTKVPAKPNITKPQQKPVIKDEIVKEMPGIVKKEPSLQKENPAIGFEKRDNSLIRTIELENKTFKVDLYDNGDIDGDTVSLFFNGKLVLAHKRLSDKALSLNLDVDPNIVVNELIMYAENLGSIPPNTAIMVVTDGGNRYEVRIASDLKKSGTIRFIHKPHIEQ